MDFDDRKAYKPVVVEIVKRLEVEPEDILILGEQQKRVASKKRTDQGMERKKYITDVLYKDRVQTDLEVSVLSRLNTFLTVCS